MITPQEALTRVIDHREIFHDEMLALMRQIMNGEVSPVLISALIVGLRVKKETIGEITAAAQVMRELATKVSVPDPSRLVDVVGTGGDGSHTFNISTAAAFVASAGGAIVAKHGSRAVSSRSGASDVLEALGVNIHLKPPQVAHCIDKLGLGFMFAPNHHLALKHAAPVRRELGVRTLFNILGPLTNPAGAPHSLLGVFHPDLVGIQVRVLQRLGSRRAMIVYGVDGLDELSVSGDTMVGELNQDGTIREYIIHPRQFHLPVHDLSSIKVSTVEASRDMLLSVLDNKPGSARDIVALNAAATLYICGQVPSIEDGLELAFELIKSGKAKEKMEAFVRLTQELGREPA